MQVLAERLALVGPPGPLLLWVVGSVVAYALGTGAFRLIERIQPQRSPYVRWIVQVGRFLFFLGIPYLTLGGWPLQPFHGLLSLEDIGLAGLNQHWPVTRWLEAVGTGLGLGFLVLLVLLLAWINAGRRLRFAPKPWWALVVDGLYLEVHWAFYRGALAVLLDDVYGGVFLGLALIYIEWGLNPWWRQGWRRVSSGAEQWLHAALALIMSLLFLLTRNLWVCLGVHWLMELAFRWLGKEVPASEASTLEISP